MTRIITFAVALTAVGCNEYDIKAFEDSLPPDALIEVTPLEINFGGVREGESVVESVTISSVGTEDLELEALELSGDGAFTLLSEVAGEVLPPGQALSVEIAYTPLGIEESGQLLIPSNAINDPEAVVSLIGAGLVPQLTVDPPEVDFGYVTPFETSTETVRLINSGGDTLEIYAVAAASEPFLATASTPISLEPGEETEMVVTFSPVESGAYLSEAIIASNAPGTDRVVPLRATSEVGPIAVCDVLPNPVQTLYERAAFIGENSYDPSGLLITTYDWSLVSVPNGSSATLRGNTSQPNRTGFVTDVAGEYVAELVVTNSVGVESEPCQVTLDSEPAQDLWVELYWAHSGDDMDLHLLRPGGTPRTNGDCYYGNCAGGRLNWGDSGSTDDDPSLDIDDIPGTGPENINIQTPEAGTFTVFVHDYPGSIYQAGNDVTVNIYLAGALVWSDTRTISNENSDTYFAEIVWPDMVVNPL
ncbi:MAG: choice-of-anchor D domain-containing protein [Alphaproteobacteria bacterium]|nr:choice-of-anchor D domain-containing protein [Alphaproteobacteria bacterium]MCB9797925.1 choice-of-anchor D domain-containing protein [Alphaproteobacteria bacterium]